MRQDDLPWVPESIRLFSLCEAMNWAVLPVTGGLYEQHPRLLEEWTVLFQKRAEHEKREQAKEQARAKSQARVMG